MTNLTEAKEVAYDSTVLCRIAHIVVHRRFRTNASAIPESVHRDTTDRAMHCSS